MAGEAGRDENYAGTFDGHLQPGKRPALLLVDMVEAYLVSDSPLYCETAAAAVAVASELADACRANGIPVILTNVEYEPGGGDGGVFYRKTPVLKVFDRGSPLGAFPPALVPREADRVVTKQYPSAFFGTGLAEQLHDQGVDTLLIGGFSTSGCVRASALDAMQYGFVPFVVREACADRHPDPHEANLFDLQAKYAEVIGSVKALGIIGTD
ncbi:isochorismatase family protein [Altererythrobacter arenosus]|uniref:Isochorismatase family protein n=1 Tax=Altererythrobacter arenosus TaxID=3032592 RepID=A0ABY8FN03_9SPHN|nr:isochorismatase family protein [Altererythrobacter sp. CAU 1644]WFL76388.1 isochorismatase family protein [Altererythrobacter sp. CAU 1644]